MKEKKHQEIYDAIVIGTGISGGWAAKELCEQGLKTLVLERGRMVEHITDYTTAHMDSWDFKYRGMPTATSAKTQKNKGVQVILLTKKLNIGLLMT